MDQLRITNDDGDDKKEEPENLGIDNDIDPELARTIGEGEDKPFEGQ